MSRRIIVAGNCQIGGVAAALQRIFPSDEVSAVPFNPNFARAAEEDLVRTIAAADIVLGSAPVLALLERNGRQPRQFLPVPGLYFSAFHPDIASVGARGGGRRLPNGSAIAAWAYNRGLDPADALRLYNRRTFTALGYFQRWGTSVALLKSSFEKAGLEFDRFYLAAKRDGVFMYTINHPKVTMLAWVAKMLAMRMGHDPSVWRKDIVVNDALSRVEIWPVYPEVANELALPGSYSWMVERGRLVEGLPAYIEYAFTKYAEAGIAPGQLALYGVDAAAYDTVLSSSLGRS